MDWHSGIVIVVVALFLMLLNYLQNKSLIANKKRRSELKDSFQELGTANQEQRMTLLIKRMEELKDSAERGRIWRSVEDEREFLEHRLGGLWGLSEIKKSLDRMNGEEYEEWRETDDNEDEVAWVQVYCRREIKKIGQRLRELDARATSEAASK
jgi:hypothetical protein